MAVARAALCAFALLGATSAASLDERKALRQQVIAFGVVCEDMCKKVMAYPNCACPGFGGTPADEGDARSCAVKYCHPPVEPCPNDAFFNCVGESTKLLQVQSLPEMPVLLQQLSAVEAAIAHYSSEVAPAIKQAKPHA